MNRELLLLVDALAREKNVPKEIVFTALESALAQQVQRPPVTQTTLLLQKEENLSPRIETFILVEDGQDFFQACEHMAVLIELPARKPSRSQPFFPPRQQAPRVEPLEHGSLRNPE